jgi:O-antigen biosynthesis protein
MKILFLLPGLGISGGTYVVFQHARFLKSQGHEVVFFSNQPENKQLSCWHPFLKEISLLTWDESTSQTWDSVVATYWLTALQAPALKAKSYVYFVQSIESRFYFGEENKFIRELVDSTYSMAFSFVTEATWIKEYLLEHHSQDCALVRNGIDKDLYHPPKKEDLPSPRKHLRVLVEGPIGIDFKQVIPTIRLLKEFHDIETWLLTSTKIAWLPKVDKLFSSVPVGQVPSIMRQCDLILKLSLIEGMFGPPLEMFHCGGTAVTYGIAGHAEYMEHEKNSLVAKVGDNNEVRKHVRRLNSDRPYLSELRTNALATASEWPDWAKSSCEFEVFLSRARFTDNLAAPSAETTRLESAFDYFGLNGAKTLKSQIKLFGLKHLPIKEFYRDVKFWVEILKRETTR